MSRRYKLFFICGDELITAGTAFSAEQALEMTAELHPDILAVEGNEITKEVLDIVSRERSGEQGGFPPPVLIVSGEQEIKFKGNSVVLWDNTSADMYANNKKVREILRYIEENYSKDISAGFAAEQLYISSSYLMHTLKRHTGKTFNEFLTETRINAAKTLLAKSNYRIYEVCEMVGYKDVKYFSQIFKKLTGMTPSEYS